MRIRLSGRIDEPSRSIFDSLLETLRSCDAELCELDLKVLEGLDETRQGRLQALSSTARAAGRRIIVHFPWRCLQGGRADRNGPDERARHASSVASEPSPLLRVVR